MGETQTVRVKTGPLEVARLVAGSAGFYDVDVEPMEPGRARVTAYGVNRRIVTNGVSVPDACDKLIRLLVQELSE